MSCHSTSGGIVSTSLAKAVTGLPEKEIQHIFHALKREAAGMPAPSELDVAEWRTRQYDLLSRMKRMSDTRRDKIRDRIFRARSESVPDGPTFHAWRTIEARARQTQALAHIDTAIDLDPPGSQAHLYDLGPDGRPTKVWYASYGSNLHRDRFMNYIEGGSPEGSTRTYTGCTDKTPPEADIPIRFAGARPHFALTSRVWRGGIAFIDAQKGESAQGLGRAYEIGITQFDEVVAQENGLSAKFAAPVPLTEALETGRSVIGEGSYETILHIGDYNGAPVLTFTAPFSTREALTQTGQIRRTPVGSATPVRMPVMTNKPSPAYLRMIGGGLNETFGMDEIAQADYLRGCPGGDRWSRQQMVRILRGEDPDPPRIPGPDNPKSTNTSGSNNSKSGSSKNKPPKATGATPSAAPGSNNHSPLFSSAPGTPPTGTAARSAADAFKKPTATTNAPERVPCPSAACTSPTHQYGSKAHRRCALRARGNQMYTPETIPDHLWRTPEDLAQRSAQQAPAPAEGSVLADLREQGLFPAADTPTARPKNRTRRRDTSTSTSTGAVATRRDNQGRRTIPNVKTYPTVEEQRRGVQRWESTAQKFTKERDSIHASVTTLQNGLTELNATDTPDEARIYATRQNLNRARTRLTTANNLLTTVNERLAQARAQRPNRYYDTTTSRSLSAWQAEDERILAQHQATETAYATKRRELADMRLNPEADDAQIEDLARATDRLSKELTTCEQRLKEVNTIITSMLDKK